MTQSATTRDYLVIEPYLADALHARTLQAAFEIGVIDDLQESGAITETELLAHRACDAAGGRFLLQVLTQSDVVQRTLAGIALTPTFSDALEFRDLLLTRLQFSELIAPDFFAKLPQLLLSADAFMATSKLFDLFDYGRCLEVTPQNCLQASRWMQLTTTLTRYEAPVCHEHYAFAGHRRMLDVGGNSGEFALQICRREPALEATIVDLPVVCHVGARHIANEPESDRITFLSLNMLGDPLPTGFDLITWKSVLHDWPDGHTEHILRAGFDALEPGGTVLIFERQQWDFSVKAMSYGLLPILLFFRSYRQPAFYQRLLDQIGFADICVQQFPLEVPFMLVTARKL